MAVIDRMRDRLRGQRPVGAAEEMQQIRSARDGIQQNMQMDGMLPGNVPTMGGGTSGTPKSRTVPMQGSGASIDSIMAGQTDEAQDAFNVGRRMGLMSLAEMNGQSVPGRQTAEGRIMTRERLQSAMNTLLRYRSGKQSVNKRIINSQEWWKLNNWDVIKKMQAAQTSSMEKPTATAWLWNAIVGKHADAMDSYPEMVFLPRMKDDEQQAKMLSSIVPVVMEMNEYEKTYSECNWQKLREGTGAYGVFWDPEKLNGLGDISITKVNMLNLNWEPGITDIQDSRNVFFCTWVDKDEVYEAYPELEGQQLGAKHFIDQYKTDDNLDLENKVPVVDWYYKKRIDGRKVLHYCKFVGEHCLFSSEEEAMNGDEQMAQGYYHDGNYPFVLDPLFPVEGSPAGYGYIDIGAGAQTKADLLDDAMTINAIMRSRPRYFSRQDGGINEEEFMNLGKPIVHTNGNLGQDSLRPVEVPDLGGGAINMLNHKIEELKFVTGNTDVMNGGAPQGVTAASALATLNEVAGRSSKDSTRSSYRAQRQIGNMVVERLRQFYTVPRMFRIMGEDAMKTEYVTFDNSGLQVQMIPNLAGQEEDMRLPVFDIEIRAQRETAYTKLAENELAIQLWGLGVYNPQMVDQALLLLDMMDFRNKDSLKEKLEQQGTIRELFTLVSQIALAATQDKPELQQRLAMILQQAAADAGVMSGGAVPGGGGLDKIMQQAPGAEEPKKDNSLVTQARNRAQEASRPQ